MNAVYLALACCGVWLLFVVLPTIAAFWQAGQTRNGDAEQMSRRWK